jgi:lysozyme family protein
MNKIAVSMIEKIVGIEGGFVDDPDDKGGATKYGISLSFLRFHNIDLTNDGVVNENDIKALTQEKAISLYIKYFYTPNKINEIYQMDVYLAYQVLDSQINMGYGSKLLQRVINTFSPKKIKVDGVIGGITLAALQYVLSTFPKEKVRQEFLHKRINRYISITKYRPTNLKYLNGWVTRAFSWDSLRLSS